MPVWSRGILMGVGVCAQGEGGSNGSWHNSGEGLALSDVKSTAWAFSLCF